LNNVNEAVLVTSVIFTLSSDIMTILTSVNDIRWLHQYCNRFTNFYDPRCTYMYYIWIL